MQRVYISVPQAGPRASEEGPEVTWTSLTTENDSAKLRKISVLADFFFHYGKSFLPTDSRGAEYPTEGLGSFDLNSQC